MLKFHWTALRQGDHVLVHDVDGAELTLRPGVVTLVDTQSAGRDVTVRTPLERSAGVRPAGSRSIWIPSMMATGAGAASTASPARDIYGGRDVELSTKRGRG